MSRSACQLLFSSLIFLLSVKNCNPAALGQCSDTLEILVSVIKDPQSICIWHNPSPSSGSLKHGLERSCVSLRKQCPSAEDTRQKHWFSYCDEIKGIWVIAVKKGWKSSLLVRLWCSWIWRLCCCACQGPHLLVINLLLGPGAFTAYLRQQMDLLRSNALKFSIAQQWGNGHFTTKQLSDCCNKNWK